MLLEQICDALEEIEGQSRRPKSITMSPGAFERIKEEMHFMGAVTGDVRQGAPPGSSGILWDVPIFEDASVADDEFEIAFDG